MKHVKLFEEEQELIGQKELGKFVLPRGLTGLAHDTPSGDTNIEHVSAKPEPSLNKEAVTELGETVDVRKLKEESVPDRIEDLFEQ
jgi:hypothetical protein